MNTGISSFFVKSCEKIALDAGLDASDAQRDQDGDGLYNSSECLLGTDPTDRDTDKDSGRHLGRWDETARPAAYQ
jgi:hypothetical protein